MILTIKDRREMNHMGYQYRAWYLNPFGVPFHKNFLTYAEMDNFNRQAHDAGTKLLGYASL